MEPRAGSVVRLVPRRPSPNRLSTMPKECPECRTINYGDLARCSACARSLADVPEFVQSSNRLVRLFVSAVVVGVVLILAVYVYR